MTPEKHHVLSALAVLIGAAPLLSLLILGLVIALMRRSQQR